MKTYLVLLFLVSTVIYVQMKKKIVELNFSYVSKNASQQKNHAEHSLKC